MNTILEVVAFFFISVIMHQYFTIYMFFMLKTDGNSPNKYFTVVIFKVFIKQNELNYLLVLTFM